MLRTARLRKQHAYTATKPSSLGLSDPLRAALEWCLTMSGAERVVLWRIDRDAGAITPVAGAGGARPGAQPLSGDPLDWAASQRVPLRIQPPPSWSIAPSTFAVPLDSADDELLVTFEVGDALVTQPTHFDGLAVYLNGVVGVEAQRRALYQEQTRANELVTTLRALPMATDANALSEQLAQAALDMVRGTGSMVAAWDGDVGSVLAVAGDAPAVGTAFRGSESEAGLAVRAAATLIRAPGALGRLPLVAPGERFARAPKAMIAVPLKIGSDVIGVVAAWRNSGITPHAAQDLETLAPYAALQLKHAREFGAMRTRAEHDALTALNNRHAFETYLAGEAARYDRYQRPFALIIFDIDHFKSINDRYGHEAGDFILQQMGDVIRGSLRSVDFAARLGGEEFVVVLPETTLAKGVEIAERVRARAQALQPQWRAQTIELTVSAGVSAIPECVPLPSGLVGSADAALYTSKRGGRNRVTAAR